MYQYHPETGNALIIIYYNQHKNYVKFPAASWRKQEETVPFDGKEGI